MKAEDSAGTRSESRRGADGVDVITGDSEGGGERTAVADDRGSSDDEEAGGTPLSPDKSVVRWARRRTTSCDLSP